MYRVLGISFVNLLYIYHNIIGGEGGISNQHTLRAGHHQACWCGLHGEARSRSMVPPGRRESAASSWQDAVPAVRSRRSCSELVQPADTARTSWRWHCSTSACIVGSSPGQNLLSLPGNKEFTFISFYKLRTWLFYSRL